ncbi:protein E17A [Elephant endotheliotropic herpesvirus 3A]|uniref:Protein E17A n=1 Tax=Elephant endotheliotropic herpesvirus 3A TaxID=1329409 RepID=A0A866VSF2_9BETA|nr:protein E17A [Elephant endotheliotropic herpesvirus 3A]QOE74386.1 protein E17A [Elephant endotheliotropic herpesvirus 3A]
MEKIPLVWKTKNSVRLSQNRHAFDKCMLSLTRDVENFHSQNPEDVENPGPDDESEDRDPCVIRAVIVHLPSGASHDSLLLEDLDPEDGERPCGGEDDGPGTEDEDRRPPATVTLEDETQVPAPRGD